MNFHTSTQFTSVVCNSHLWHIIQNIKIHQRDSSHEAMLYGTLPISLSSILNRKHAVNCCSHKAPSITWDFQKIFYSCHKLPSKAVALLWVVDIVGFLMEKTSVDSLSSILLKKYLVLHICLLLPRCQMVCSTA